MNIVNLSESCKGIDFLHREFSEVEFVLLESADPNRISCFVAKLKNSSALHKDWSNIVSLIAAEYQSRLENEFSVWNIYLAFICTEIIDMNLKYEIENDKFSMRKIVADGIQLDNINEITKYFNNEILGKDLTIAEVSTTFVSERQTASNMQKLIESLGYIPSGHKDDAAAVRVEKLKTLLALVLSDEN